MSSKYMNERPQVSHISVPFSLTLLILTFQSFESPRKYTSTLAMLTFVDPPESVTNTVLAFRFFVNVCQKTLFCP